MLLEEGANCNQPDSKGKTAMEIAKSQNINSSHEGVLDVLNMAIAAHRPLIGKATLGWGGA